jgi:chondroitin 4-sulfotransferase 11
LARGDDVTFQEFATYLTGQEGVLNEHWRPIYDLCHPCSISYDIIGKYETLDQDSDFILKQVGETRITFPRAPKASSTTSNLRKYFGSLQNDVIRRLYDIYVMDFKLFGYNLHEFLGYETG